MSGLTCFVSTPTQKCSYTVTDIVYPDVLENFHADCSRYSVPVNKRATVVYTALQVGHLRGCSNFWSPHSPKLKTFYLVCGYPNRDAVNVPTFPTTSPELLWGLGWCG